MRMAIFYLILGVLFTYLAISSVQETVWNATTILLALVATLDFGIAFRYFRMHKNRPKK